MERPLRPTFWPVGDGRAKDLGVKALSHIAAPCGRREMPERAVFAVSQIIYMDFIRLCSAGPIAQ